MESSHGTRRLTILEMVAVFLVAVLFVVLAANIAMRYVGVTFVWVEEFTIALFIWLVFLGATLAFRRGEHPVVELGYQTLRRKLPWRVMVAVDVILAFLTMVFLLVFGIGLAGMMRRTWGQSLGIVPGFRVGFLYLGVLISCIASLLSVGHRTLTRLRTARSGGIQENASGGSSII